jgi:hypothetical protein
MYPFLDLFDHYSSYLECLGSAAGLERQRKTGRLVPLVMC